MPASDIQEGVDAYLLKERGQSAHGRVGNEEDLSQEFENMDLFSLLRDLLAIQH